MNIFIVAVIAIIIVAVAAAAITGVAATTYSATVSKLATEPVISHDILHNSDFRWSYNTAAYTNSKSLACLLVRCQNKSSSANPLGTVTPSKIALSCAQTPNPFGQYAPIKAQSVVFEPTPGANPPDPLGTEDPRVLLVNGTLYMFYTAVAKSPTGGATARLSLATCDTTTGQAANPNCWRRRGQLIPDPLPGVQFTKSAALLYDAAMGQRLLIFGDSTIVEGLQVMEIVSDNLGEPSQYKLIENFLLIKPRPNSFDSELVESGPPPLRLPNGNWFFIYNSAQRLWGAPNKLLYNAGWVILNGSQPLHVLQRAAEPLLMPQYVWQTAGLTPYVVFVEGMRPSKVSGAAEHHQHHQHQHSIQRAEMKSASATSASFDIWYGAADSNVGVATVTVSWQ